MPLVPGQIIGNDLSPNANILGNQIADKTISFRNLADDTFKIIKVLYITQPIPALTTGAGTWASASSTVTTAHNLGFIPFTIGYTTDSSGSFYYPTPFVFMKTFSGSPQWEFISISTDGTNLYTNCTVQAYNTTFGSGSTNLKVFLLQETIT